MSTEPLTGALEETLAVFDEGGAPRTTPEVAERLDLGRRSAYARLERLADEGWLQTKKVGANARVWWRPTTDTDDAPPEWSGAADSLDDDVLGDVEAGIFVLDEAFEVVWTNEAAERYFGLDGEAVVGRDKRRLVEERFADTVADSERFAETVLAAYDDDDTSTERFRCRVTPGEGREERWLEHRSEPIDTGAYAGGRVELYYDVTDRERSQRATEEDRREFSSLVEAVEEYAIFTLDADGHVRTWNPGAEQIKGYEADEILGEHFSTFYTQDARDAGVPGENLAAAAEQGSVEDEGWRVRADGSRFWANPTITAIRDDDGDLRRFAKVTRDMTERREYEQRLRQERNLNRQVLEATPAGIFVVDADGAVTMANERFRERVGVEDPTADLSVGDLRIFDASGDLVPPEERPYRTVFETGEAVSDWDCQVELPDGSRRWATVNVSPITGDDGEVERAVVAAQDVTRLHEQEEQLRRQRDELRDELDEVFDRISDGFFGLDDDLQFTFVNGRAEDLLGLEEAEVVGADVRSEIATSDEFEAALEEALETQEPVHREDYYPPLDAWFESSIYPSESGLSVYFRDVTGRKQREQELEQYETIVETINEGVYVVDDEGRFTWVNGTYAEMTGYDREELVGAHVSKVVDEETAEIAREKEAKLRAGASDVSVVEADLTTADGESFPAAATFSLLSTGDGEDRRVGVVRDISERRERERELERYAGLVDAVGEPVYELDTRGRFTFVNEPFLDVSGYDEEEVLGEPVTIGMDEEAIARVQSRIADLIETGDDRTIAVEYEVTTKDGERIPVENRLALLTDDEGRIRGTAGILLDVTERRERERELEESERRYRTLAENFPNGAVGVYDDDLRYELVEGAMWEDMEPGPEDLEGNTIHEAFDEAITADIEPVFRAAIEDGETTSTLTEFVGRTLQVWATPLRDDDGEIFVGLSFAQDVTEQKRRERELEEYETIVSTMEDGVYVMDDAFEFVMVNDAYVEMTGYDREELLGAPASLVVDDAVVEASSDSFAEMLAGDAENATLEADIQRADGSTLRAESKFTAVEGADGGDDRKVGVVRDVSERVERERELEESRRRLRTLVDNFPKGAVALVDEDLTYVTVGGNPVLESDVGAADLEGKNAREVLPPDVADLLVPRYEAALDGEPSTFEGDVGDRTYQFQVVPVRDDDGEVFAALGMSQDVTERKEYERYLREAKDQLEAATEAGAVGTFEWDVRADEMVVGRSFAETLGIDPEAAREGVSLDQFLERIHPEDRERVEEQIDATLEACEEYETEYRVRDADGEYRWVVARGRVECDDDGAPLSFPGAVTDITARKEVELELQRRVRQQDVVTELGRQALTGDDLDALIAEAAELVAETLDNDYCKVLDLDPDAEELLLRQGVGWDDGIVGEATVSADEDDSQASYTLSVEHPVVVEDLDTETRFSGPELLTSHDVHSGISVIIGPPDDPWGILGTHDTAAKTFSQQDAAFVQSVANVLASAIERHEHEQALLDQHEQLAALNALNEVVRDITEAVIEQSTREEIETTVCERLAATESYLFAWAGETDANTGAVNLRTEAGVEGYLDGISISVDPDDARGEGPTGRALRTGEMQVTQDIRTDDRHDPWREHAEEHGVRSSAAIPVTHEETVYGVLNVYADRPYAFDGQEGEMLDQLGEIVGHAIAAAERKRALMSDELVELEFRIQDVFAAVGLDGDASGTITLDHAVPLEDDEFLVYGTATPDGVDTVRAIVDAAPHWESLTVHSEGDPVTFEVRLSEPPVLSAIAARGGYVEKAVIEDGDYRMTIHLAPTVDVRSVIETVEEAYPQAEMLRRQQISRTREDATHIQRAFSDALTDRQRTVLEVAYHAGFFEWPRETNGEELAASLDVAPPTFHQHLRKAEQAAFDVLFSMPA